jgi:transglutaminase-like putative cysteine protease
MQQETDADPLRAFRERARLEAERYGPDPWIFVRELLQNARDAGATRVRFGVFDRESQGEEATVVCQDNGEGMTFDHARRYLFSLYASSKEGKKNQAGKFGVGFWSILRFEPTMIIIRSRPRQGAAWGVSLDGKLEQALAVDPPPEPGTEIILRRPRRATAGGSRPANGAAAGADTSPGSGSHDALEPRIHDAVWQSARYLGQRDQPDTPLDIEVNGRKANAEFSLPAPSGSFRHRHVKGVVGLGSSPRVELFSRGLRVRSAACLEDLLAPGGRHTSWMRVQFAELPGGLAPQALLESPDLELMLSRSDARDNRALSKLVRLAQRELERLIDRQLAAARPMPWWSRIGNWLTDRLRSLRARQLGRSDALVLAAGLLIALLVIWRSASDPTPLAAARDPAPAPAASAPSPSPSPSSSPAPTGGEPTAASAAPTGARPFQDLGPRYRGPSVDALAPNAVEPVALRYRPTDARPHFAALTFARLAADGSPVPSPVARPVGRYAPARCEEGCLEVELQLAADQPVLRIPVPTGHRVVGGSLSLAGQQAPRLRADEDGRAVVVLAGASRGLLRYRTAPMPDPVVPRLSLAPYQLPAGLGRRARQLRALPLARRVEVLREVVRRRVAYDASPTTARRHRESQARQDGFIQRALAIGAGDCDVQNGLYVALLQAAGVPARLAIGYLADQGRVFPWVHAWVEHVDEGGRWVVADASEARATRATAAARPGRARRAAGTDDAPEADAVDEEPVTAPAPAPTSAPAPAPLPSTLKVPPGPSPSASAWAMSDAMNVPRAPPPARASEAARPVAHGGGSGPGLALVAPVLALLLGVWWYFFGRTRRTFSLDRGADLPKLLQGVLQQPAAFSHIRALFYRPLIPRADGKAISLTRARDLASRGRLFCTRRRPPLARHALQAGAVVLDHGVAEGKIVADALGAVDLDGWAPMIDGIVEDPLLDGVNQLLLDYGESWAVRASGKVDGGLAAIDLVPLGGRIPGLRLQATRLVLVDAAATWLTEARVYFESRPQAAIFMVLDQLALRLHLPVARRGPLLGESARQAILESFAT